jgi:hypothetical protein
VHVWGRGSCWLSAVGIAVFLTLLIGCPSVSLASPPQVSFVARFGGIGSGAGDLNVAAGMAVDEATGNVYVADDDNERIDEFNSSGGFVKAWGAGVSDGTSSTYQTCTTSCRQGVASGSAGAMNRPKDVAIDGSGHLFVADSSNQRIDEFDVSGSFVRAWGWGVADGQSQFETCTVATGCTAGAPNGGAGGLSAPFGVAVSPSGHVLVAEYFGARVSEFDPSTATTGFVRAWGWGVDGSQHFSTCTSSCASGSSAQAQAGSFDGATGIAVDPADGDVYVVDTLNYRVQRFAANGSFLSTWGWGVTDGQNQFEICTSGCESGVFGSGTGQFAFPIMVPSGIEVDASGDVDVADFDHDRVQQFTTDGTFLNMFGWGVADGQSHFENCSSACQAGLQGESNGQLSEPDGVAVDSAGDEYVDNGDQIQKFSIPVVQHSLTVSENGSGSGTVTSSPAGLNCGSTCAARFDAGTVVTLTASPAAGSAFGGWSGACGSSATCMVTLNSDQSITATFASTDSTAPVSSATSPTYSQDTSFQVQYTDSDGAGGSGVGSLDLWVKGPSDSSYSPAQTVHDPPANGSITFSATEGDGTYSFYTLATDNAGNLEARKTTPDAQTAVDTVPPNAAVGVADYVSVSPIFVGIISGDPDPGTGIANNFLFLKGPRDSAFQEISYFGGGVQTPLLEGPGTYSFYAEAEDRAGNVSSPSSVRTVLYETTPPTISLTTPADGAVYAQGQRVAASYTCSDAQSGIASCSGPVASGSDIDTSPGPHTFTVNASDRASNTSSTTSHYYVDARPSIVSGPRFIEFAEGTGEGVHATASPGDSPDTRWTLTYQTAGGEAQKLEGTGTDLGDFSSVNGTLTPNVTYSYTFEFANAAGSVSTSGTFFTAAAPGIGATPIPMTPAIGATTIGPIPFAVDPEGAPTTVTGSWSGGGKSGSFSVGSVVDGPAGWGVNLASQVFTVDAPQVSGLSPLTTYKFHFIATNDVGPSTFDESFTTSAPPNSGPTTGWTALTGSASAVTSTSASVVGELLIGSQNTNTTAFTGADFDVYPAPSAGQPHNAADDPSWLQGKYLGGDTGNHGAGSVYGADATGLNPGTTYDYVIAGTNSYHGDGQLPDFTFANGIKLLTLAGSVQQFTTSDIAVLSTVGMLSLNTKTVTVSTRCATAGPCAGTSSLTTSVLIHPGRSASAVSGSRKKPARKVTIVLGTARFRIPGHHRGPLLIHLTKRGRTYLQGHPKAKTTLSIHVRIKHHEVTTTVALKLRQGRR